MIYRSFDDWWQAVGAKCFQPQDQKSVRVITEIAWNACADNMAKDVRQAVAKMMLPEEAES
jgi:hypothetical protein